MINIFISYSYDNDDHEKWVNKLADDLEKYKEFHVIYQYCSAHLLLGQAMDKLQGFGLCCR